MKKITTLILGLLMIASFGYSQVSISAAHTQAVGTSVTVRGIVTNGSELGPIRYMQDTSGGIAAYSATMSAVVRGDDVTVTGTLSDYNGLLEISPVTSFTINSSGNALPLGQVLTPNQLSEAYESELVKIPNVTFTNGGGTFASNSSYIFTSGAQSGTVYVRTGNPLVGTIIPNVLDTLIGIASQYLTTYQLLPRDANDFIYSGSIQMTSLTTPANITTSGMDINWTTNINGSTYIQYGRTTALELGVVNGTGNTVNHTATITGANPADIFYVRAFSVSGTDTASSMLRVFATVSASTGTIKVYFNRPVNNSVSTTINAIQLPGTIDDTLIQYINRAKYTIDLAIYSLDNTNLANMTTALNDAYTNRGVRVRVVSDGANANTSLNNLVAGIHRISSPTSAAYGIMHNKFVIFDAHSPNPNEPVLWTGSTNLTSGQITTDANNLIIFQDQSIAKGYELEFNEMWGDTGATPNAGTEKFGPYKIDNTPHEYLIGAKRVESYFSPSDGVNSQILNAMSTANRSMYFLILSFTRSDLSYEITNKFTAGINIAGMVDDSVACSNAWNILKPVMGSRLLDHNVGGLLHHKYLIVDQDMPASDPLVLTGSHNWSNSADQKNDENTVIVHDDTIANIYFQEFYARFLESGGVLAISKLPEPELMQFMAFPNPATDNCTISFNLKNAKSVEINLFDMTGRNIYSNKTDALSGINQNEIRTSDLAAGMYIISVRIGGEMLSGKLSITH